MHFIKTSGRKTRHCYLCSWSSPRLHNFSILSFLFIFFLTLESDSHKYFDTRQIDSCPPLYRLSPPTQYSSLLLLPVRDLFFSLPTSFHFFPFSSTREKRKGIRRRPSFFFFFFLVHLTYSLFFFFFLFFFFYRILSLSIHFGLDFFLLYLYHLGSLSPSRKHISVHSVPTPAFFFFFFFCFAWGQI